MRTLGQTTLTLCNEVDALGSARGLPWQGGAQVQLVEKLNRIAESGEWLAIPRIIGLALDSRDEIANAVGGAVAILKRGVSVRQIGRFDRAFRELSPYLHGEYVRWHGMKPRDLLWQVCSVSRA